MISFLTVAATASAIEFFTAGAILGATVVATVAAKKQTQRGY